MFPLNRTAAGAIKALFTKELARRCQILINIIKDMRNLERFRRMQSHLFDLIFLQCTRMAAREFISSVLHCEKTAVDRNVLCRQSGSRIAPPEPGRRTPSRSLKWSLKKYLMGTALRR
jgi:hypothetical protein